MEVSRTILESDVDGAFLDSEYPKQPRDFVRVFRWIFENHEQIQSDGRKAWTPEQQVDLTGADREADDKVPEVMQCQ